MNPLRKSLYGVLALLFLWLSMSTLWAQAVQNVTLVGNFGRGEGEAKSVFAAGSLVYYGIGNKLQIASFSNPANPLKVASVILPDVIEGLVRTSISGTQYLVVVGGPKMWLINVQNPTAPSITATVNIGSTCEGVATSGTTAYVAAGGLGLQIYNIANPANPAKLASIDSLEYCESVVISAPYAYIAAADRSHIVNISNPATPLYAGRIPALAGGYHQYLNVRGGHAYICDFNAGLQVVNV
ncbi:MAG: LVIVD repeat-containing protein, partial [bacterium]